MKQAPKALKRALKHQKRLSILKFLIMGLAALTIVLIIGVPYYFDSKNRVLQEEKKKDVTEEVSEKKILAPHFEGVDEKNQPYFVKAEDAIQISEEQIDLTHPEGEIVLTNGEKMSVSANEGVLTHQNKRLDLTGDVKLDYANCRVRADQAQADLETKIVQGGKVLSHCPEGMIKAGGFKVDQERGIVTYEDRPHLILHGNDGNLSPIKERKP